MQFLKKYNVSADKKLGQNFLVDGNVVRKIINTASVDNEIVLEIGSGPGTLTELLSERANKVFAVEIDRKILNVLKEVIEGKDNIEIINSDFLMLDFESLKINGQKIKIVGNLPYYITSQILFKLFENRKYIKDFTIMVQKEVAQRLLSQPNSKEYGVITVAFNFYCEIVEQFSVSKNVFFPVPDVDSKVIKACFKDTIPDIDHELFFNIIHACFGTRRKTLLNSLCLNMGLNKEQALNILSFAKISPEKRAENLTVLDYLKLYFGYIENMQ